MDKTLKRRLVGASILIALAVIFVPMLLVDPDVIDPGATTEVDVPEIPDSAREVRRIPLDPRAARRPDADGESPEPPESASAPEGEVSPGRRRVDPEAEIVLRPELAGADDEAADAGAGTEPSAPAPAGGADADTDTVAPETPAGSAPDDAPDPEISLGDWAVQVASFGSAQSANQVRERLEALGHIVQRDEIVRGESLLYRLRTGPYPSRSAANQAREQIRATVRGVEPLVMRIDEQSAASAEPGFAVQVGSFIGENNAVAETERLDGLGFEVFRFSEEVGERTVWRVMVGPLPSRTAADQLRDRLVDEAGVEGLVVSWP